MVPLFVVLTADGQIKLNRERRMMIYTTMKAAKTSAKDNGDAVVYLELDHETEPLFIRGRVIPVDE